MKKIIILIAAVLTLCTPAFAEDEAVAVLYNGTELTFSDAEPVIIDGRTLLPFRGVFEQMGAVVGYDEATRTATANFNGIEIYFSIDGNEIYSTASAEPVYTMDVPPTIINGRTLVPVRAVAEAGGLTVGWDEAERSVIVYDEAAVRREIEAACTDLEAFRALFEGEPQPYTQTETAELTLEKSGLSFTLQSEINFDSEARSIVSNIGLEASGAAETATLETIVTTEAMYIKTDLVEKLAAVTGDSDLSLAALLFSGDRWFMVDYAELETFIAGDNGGAMEDTAYELLNGTTELELVEETIDNIVEVAASFSADYIDSAIVASAVRETIDSQKEYIADMLRVTYNADGTATAVITMSDENGTEELNLTSTYSSGVELSSELSLEIPGVIEAASSLTGSVGAAERVIIPEEYTDFVDTLYTILNNI